MGLMAEKGSCRFLHNKTQLLKEDMCIPCTEQSRWSSAKLARSKDATKGCCRRLYYENGTRIAVRATTQAHHMVRTTKSCDDPRQQPTRSRKPPKLLDSTPTAKMVHTYNGRKSETNAKHTCRADTTTPSKCQCPVQFVLNRCVEVGGGKVNRSMGGTSKSAVNKQKRYERGAMEGKF